MDSKTLIAMVLMVLIYFYFFVPAATPPEQQTSSTTQTEMASTKTEEQNLKGSIEQKPETSSEASSLKALRSQELTLKNSKIEITMNRLGEIVHFDLFNYKQEIDSEDSVEWNFSKIGVFNETELRADGQNPAWKFIQLGENMLVLQASQGNREFRREVKLKEDSYVLEVSDSVLNKSDKILVVDYELKLQKPVAKEQQSRSIFNPYADVQEIVWSEDKDLEKKQFENLSSEPVVIDRAVDWAGFSTRYFFLGVVPKTASISSLEIYTRELSSKEGGEIDFATERLKFRSKQIEPGAESSFAYEMYLGPKKVEELAHVSTPISHVIDYTTLLGFITKPISRLLLSLMLFFYNWISNYGVAIILMTIVVKLVLLPLAWKGSVGMKRLALIQPKVAEVREKYKKDPQRLQAETMKMWKSEKVNPFGGCLPLVVQIPVFFALYPVFLVSIEMRHAPFFGWLNDLSASDPFFILPILLTAVMYGQQKIMPTPMPSGGAENEAVKIQKAMFKVMPVLMGAFSLFMPSGLSLYIFVNVVFSIIQQAIFNKKMEAMFPNANAQISTPQVNGSKS